MTRAEVHAEASRRFKAIRQCEAIWRAGLGEWETYWLVRALIRTLHAWVAEQLADDPL